MTSRTSRRDFLKTCAAAATAVAAGTTLLGRADAQAGDEYTVSVNTDTTNDYNERELTIAIAGNERNIPMPGANRVSEIGYLAAPGVPDEELVAVGVSHIKGTADPAVVRLYAAADLMDMGENAKPCKVIDIREVAGEVFPWGMHDGEDMSLAYNADDVVIDSPTNSICVSAGHKHAFPCQLTQARFGEKTEVAGCVHPGRLDGLEVIHIDGEPYIVAYGCLNASRRNRDSGEGVSQFLIPTALVFRNQLPTGQLPRFASRYEDGEVVGRIAYPNVALYFSKTHPDNNQINTAIRKIMETQGAAGEDTLTFYEVGDGTWERQHVVDPSELAEYPDGFNARADIGGGDIGNGLITECDNIPPNAPDFVERSDSFYDIMFDLMSQAVASDGHVVRPVSLTLKR